jgi:hypothetical protein
MRIVNKIIDRCRVDDRSAILQHMTGESSHKGSYRIRIQMPYGVSYCYHTRDLDDAITAFAVLKACGRVFFMHHWNEVRYIDPHTGMRLPRPA